MEAWHDDDRFWETMAPVIFGEQRWVSAATEIDHVLALLGVQPGIAVLDLCCGPGRHSLELARRGFCVTGVDRTAAYLDRARQLASQEGLNVEFLQDDMRRFCRPSSFEAAISLFTSFGFFEDPSENQAVLTNLYRSLKDGGAIIVDVMGKETLARVFQERDWDEQEGYLFLQEHKVSRNWSWMENRWIMIRGRDRHEWKVNHYVYSATELEAMLRASGFRAVSIYGSLEGAPYDHMARRLVAVARK